MKEEKKFEGEQLIQKAEEEILRKTNLVKTQTIARVNEFRSQYKLDLFKKSEIWLNSITNGAMKRESWEQIKEKVNGLKEQDFKYNDKKLFESQEQAHNYSMYYLLLIQRNEILERRQ